MQSVVPTRHMEDRIGQTRTPSGHARTHRHRQSLGIIARSLRRPPRQDHMHPTRAMGMAFAFTLLGACASTAPLSNPSGGPGAGAVAVTVPVIRRPAEETPGWWFRDGAAQAAQRGAMGARAKNVILFVGDGMSLTTVAAARILEGQRKGGSGEENRLSWETFPATALSRT